MTGELLHVERGGAGARRFLLLHGLGATGAVFQGVRSVIEERRLGKWICPDLPGHGGSSSRANYSVAEMATVLAPIVANVVPTIVIGHSLGTYLGLALAGSSLRSPICAVLGVGPKVTWPESDVRMMQELAARPVRFFDQEADAIERYRKVSGLTGPTMSRPELLARGVTRADKGFRLSQDPRTFGVAGASFASLVSGTRCKLLLARGESDHMVSLAELKSYCSASLDIVGAGHNAHVDDPAAVLELALRLLVDG